MNKKQLPYSDRATMEMLAKMGLERKNMKLTPDNLYREIQNVIAPQAYRHSYTANPELGRNASPRSPQYIQKAIFPSLYSRGGFIDNHCRSAKEAKYCENSLRSAASKLSTLYFEKALNVRIRRTGDAPKQNKNFRWTKDVAGWASQRERVKYSSQDPPEIQDLKKRHNRNVELMNYRYTFVLAYLAAVLDLMLRTAMPDIDRFLDQQGYFNMDPQQLRRTDERTRFATRIQKYFHEFFKEYDSFAQVATLGEEIYESKKGIGKYRPERDVSKTGGKRLKKTTQKITAQRRITGRQKK